MTLAELFFGIIIAEAIAVFIIGYRLLIERGNSNMYRDSSREKWDRWMDAKEEIARLNRLLTEEAPDGLDPMSVITADELASIQTAISQGAWTRLNTLLEETGTKYDCNFFTTSLDRGSAHLLDVRSGIIVVPHQYSCGIHGHLTKAAASKCPSNLPSFNRQPDQEES